MKSIGTIGMILHHKGCAVWSVTPDATVYEAIGILAEKNIGALPVVDGGRLVGIFSERDYTRKVALEGRSSRDTRVREIVSAPVISITPEHSIEDAMRLMSEKHIRHLPVLEGDKMVGMVSIGDLVTWIISAQNSTIDQMEAYIAGR
jgi:CBS domain-containing protein